MAIPPEIAPHPSTASTWGTTLRDHPLEPLEPLEPLDPLEPLEPLDPLEPLEQCRPLLYLLSEGSEMIDGNLLGVQPNTPMHTCLSRSSSPAPLN